MASHLVELPDRLPCVRVQELMARLGHSSVRAAMIYQHATRDQAIAKALGTPETGLIRTPEKDR